MAIGLISNMFRNVGNFFYLEKFQIVMLLRHLGLQMLVEVAGVCENLYCSRPSILCILNQLLVYKNKVRRKEMLMKMSASPARSPFPAIYTVISTTFPILFPKDVRFSFSFSM